MLGELANYLQKIQTGPLSVEGHTGPQINLIWNKGLDVKSQTIKILEGPGVVAHAYNPSTLGGRGGSRGQEIETILVNMVKPRLY